MNLLRKISNRIENLNERVGRATAVLTLFMVIMTVLDVFLRYLFRAGSVAVQELEWHLFSAIFLLGAACTLKHDGHVRVDVLYRSRRVSDDLRRAIDMAGIVLFLMPFCALVVWASIPFVYDAWAHGEISPDPGGLTHRWAVKAFIPVGFSLLFLQGLADLCRLIANPKAGD